MTIRLGWYWLWGWRDGLPSRGGTYLVQLDDGDFAVASWVRGGSWSSMRRVSFWKQLSGPLRGSR